MQKYGDHGKTKGKASDGIKLEKKLAPQAGLDPVCPLIHSSTSRVLLLSPRAEA